MICIAIRFLLYAATHAQSYPDCYVVVLKVVYLNASSGDRVFREEQFVCFRLVSRQPGDWKARVRHLSSTRMGCVMSTDNGEEFSGQGRDRLLLGWGGGVLCCRTAETSLLSARLERRILDYGQGHRQPTAHSESQITTLWESSDRLLVLSWSKRAAKAEWREVEYGHHSLTRPLLFPAQPGASSLAASPGCRLALTPSQHHASHLAARLHFFDASTTITIGLL